MINKDQLRKQVIQYFRSIGSGQNIVQCIKQALFLHEQFNPVVLFEIISKGKQKIAKDDWRNYLVDHNINFSEEELKYFISHYDFSNDATLNQFLEAMIPYNADVVRQFKQKYLDALQIKDFDPEVQFIFSELLINEFKFIRTIINIREDITSIASRKTIQNLIKQDLVLQSKPRQSRKFHQQFHKRDCELGFHELRKFLEIWVSNKEIVHQFYLLNVLRHLKSDNPFGKIIYNHKGGKGKSKKSRGVDSSNPSGQNTNNRAYSAPKVNMDNAKIRQELSRNNKDRSKDKYADFKHQVMDQFIKDKYNLQDDRHIQLRKMQDRINDRDLNRNRSKERQRQEQKERSPIKNELSYNNPNNKVTYFDNSQNKRVVQQKGNSNKEQLKRSRMLRQMKGVNGQLLVSILQEIVLKQERLEKLRKNLAKLNDFNLINLFKLIDYRNNGYVTAKDIGQFTEDSCKGNQLIDLVTYYGKQPNKLRFHQFCLIFRPLSKQLNQILDSRPEHKIPNPFKKQTMKLIFQVLNLSSEMHTNIKRKKQDIYNRGMHGADLFNFVDLENKGYIMSDCIKRVLQENNIFCDGKDLKCIMRFFRKKVDEGIKV